MPGHPARSVELRLIEGTKSGNSQLDRPVAPSTNYPDPPAWFQPEAVKVYHETIRRLREIAVASEVDYDFLITYCMTIMVMRECERAFAKVGVARSRKYKMWEATSRRLLAMSKELGLTPASRSGMRIKPEEPRGPGLFEAS